MRKLVSLAVGAGAALLALALAAPEAVAVTFVQTSGGLTVVDTFDDLGTPPTSHGLNGIVARGLFDLGEAFDGQIVSDGPLVSSKVHEIISGAPSTTLALTPPAAADGVGARILGSSAVVAGMSAFAGASSDFDRIGAGALSILFDHSQTSFGLDLMGVDGTGSLVVQFFARSGALIDTSIVALNGVSNGGSVHWTSTSAFAGVTFTNTDNGGIFFDNLRLGSTDPTPDATMSVPEATGLLLLGSLALGAFARRRRR